MPLSLAERFGANATLQNGILSVSIADLAAVGLDSADPNADQLLASLILLNELNQPAEAANNPSLGIVISAGFKTFSSRGDATHLEIQKTISFFVPDTTSGVDPDELVS